MSQSSLKYAFALSLLLNIGVIGAAGYQAVKTGELWPVLRPAQPAAAEFLRLSPEQRQRWHALEADFMREWAASTKAIAGHHEKLIRGIFSERPAIEDIEAERVAIARLQTGQQQRVIAQLLKEREILDPDQRRALADLLLQQAPEVTPVEQVHRK